MELVSVLAAAAASWIVGAVYYMVLAKPWMAASGVEVGEDGKPANGSSPTPYIVSLVMMIVVAGMMRHIFGMAGIDGAGKGLVSGLGIGAFFIAPWIVINTGYSNRPWALALIDGGYAALGCAAMGLVLAIL